MISGIADIIQIMHKLLCCLKHIFGSFPRPCSITLCIGNNAEIPVL